MQPTSVILVERNRLFREGLKRILVAAQFEVAAEASDLDAFGALDQAGSGPNIFLIDLAERDRKSTRLNSSH